MNISLAIAKKERIISGTGSQSCANPTRVGLTHAEILVLRDRIDNWRRHYRAIQRIYAVSWYSPPPAGDVFTDEIVVRLPTNLRDAAKLELIWRNLPNESAVKWYLKWEYILRNQRQSIWRRLKAHGVRIKNDREYEDFDRIALDLLDFALRNLALQGGE